MSLPHFAKSAGDVLCEMLMSQCGDHSLVPRSLGMRLW